MWLATLQNRTSGPRCSIQFTIDWVLSSLKQSLITLYYTLIITLYNDNMEQLSIKVWEWKMKPTKTKTP